MGILLTQVSINNAVNLTFQQLGALINDNKISAGKIYRVNNWKSSYMEWNGSTYNVVQVSDYPIYSSDFTINDPHTGQPYSSEPLYMLGLSGNRLASTVWSELFPYDEITFEFDFSGLNNTVNLSKSRITRRKDNIKGIDCFYDWRWIKFPRFQITLSHKVTYNTIINDFITTPILNDTIIYTGFSPYQIDYPLFVINTSDRLIETQILISLYEHYLTFIDYKATGFENIYISKKSIPLSTFELIGNNVVFHTQSHNIQLTDCEDLTFTSCNDIILNDSNFSIFNNSSIIDAQITDSVIHNVSNLTGTMNKFFISMSSRFVINNNKFKITECILSDWTTQSADNIISDNDLHIISSYIGGTTTVLSLTNFSIIGNIGNMIGCYLYHDIDSFDYPKIIASLGIPDDLTYIVYSNYKSFNYNKFDLLLNCTIQSYFFTNTFNTLENIIVLEPFFENSITGNILNITFDNIIFKKIKTPEYSTFEKVIPIDRIVNLDPLIPDGPNNANFFNDTMGYRLNINADEFQYVGIFYLDYPYSYWTLNGNEEIFYVDVITLNSLPQHRIMFKHNANSDFNWFLVFRNTAPNLISSNSNIMLANTTILPLSETNRDWVIFSADGINTGSVMIPNVSYVWQQFDAQTYNTFGSDSWPFGVDSMTAQDSCCPASDILYNNSLYLNVQDALDAALFQNLVLSDVIISNVGIIYGDPINQSSNREIGESVNTFKVSFTSNKKMSMITEIQISLQRTPTSMWENLTLVNGVGNNGYYQYVPFTTAPFNNPNAVNLEVIVYSSQLTADPITKTAKIRIKVKTTSINPLSLLLEEVDYISYMNFYYPLYYGSTGLPIDVNTFSSVNAVKRLEFLNQAINIQPDFTTKFKIQNITDKYLFFGLHKDLLNNFFTNQVNPFNIVSTQVYNPEIRTNGIKDYGWITYLITRPNPWNNTINEDYIIFRSQYKNTSRITPIEITNSLI
jgi:hypothetical protein